MKESLSKPAILIIDTVEDFFSSPGLAAKRKELVKNINQLCQVGRENDVPIVWVRQEFKPDLSDAYLGLRKSNKPITVENTPGSRLLPELQTAPEDKEIIKKRFSAFFGTGLDELLGQLEVSSLIIGGVKTHACIRTSVIDAYERDFPVVIASDCIGDTDIQHAEISFSYLTKYIAIAMGNPEIISSLKTG